MKKLLSIISSAMVLCFLAGAAWAVPITFEDERHIDPYWPVYTGNPCSYTHNIIDDGYLPGTDTLLSAFLIQDVVDQYHSGDPWMRLQIYDGAADAFVNVGTYKVGFSFINVNLSGYLNDIKESPWDEIHFKAWTTGDAFLFRDSYLIVNVDRPVTAPIPEPTAILLLGLGMIGLAGVRRKFKRRIV